MIVQERDPDQRGAVNRWMSNQAHSQLIMGLVIVFGYWILGTNPIILGTLWPYVSAAGVLLVVIALLEIYFQRSGRSRPSWMKYLAGPTVEEREARVFPRMIEIENLTGEDIVVKVEWWPGTRRDPRITTRRAGLRG